MIPPGYNLLIATQLLVLLTWRPPNHGWRAAQGPDRRRHNKGPGSRLQFSYLWEAHRGCQPGHRRVSKALLVCGLPGTLGLDERRAKLLPCLSGEKAALPGKFSQTRASDDGKRPMLFPLLPDSCSPTDRRSSHR